MRIPTTKDVLHNLYVERQLSTSEIASILGVSRRTVTNRLRKHGIALRRRTPHISAETLRYLYFAKGLTVREVARTLGVSTSTVSGLMRQHGIKARSSPCRLAAELRFYERLLIGVPPKGCWIWLDKLTDKGYGQLTVDGTTKTAHRYSWELLVGPIKAGHDLHHFFCGNKHCCNPAHLQELSKAEHGRLHAVVKTHCVHGHEYTEANTYRYPDGERSCRVCRRRAGGVVGTLAS